MARLDLAIRGGRIVSPGQIAQADIGISGGKIVQIGGNVDAAQEIDARGKLVLPGVVDAHVHVSVPPGRVGADPNWVDDFHSGSAAAVAGGVTTIGNMTFLKPGETPIVPIMLGDARLASQFADALLGEGIYVIGFSYPVVPHGQARIRVQLSAGHSPEHIERALAGFSKIGKQLGVIA